MVTVATSERRGNNDESGGGKKVQPKMEIWYRIGDNSKNMVTIVEAYVCNINNGRSSIGKIMNMDIAAR